jgi:hypothetical protein
MTDSTDTDGGEAGAIERAIDAVFTARAAREIHDAVDFEAILADQPADEPIDVDRVADALGRPVGRLIAKRLVDSGGATGLAKHAVVSRVGDRVVTEAIQATADAVDLGPAGEPLGDVDAGGDASGVHDTAGDDHEGVLGETGE